MESTQIPATDPEELLDQMAHLVGDQERRQFFDRRPELLTREQVQHLCEEVARQVSIHPERAVELAATARFVAAQLGDDRCRALAARAAANAYQFSGDNELAQKLYDSALELFEQQGDRVAAAITRSSALHNLAYLGRYAEVYSWEAAARETLAEVDDRLRLAILDHNLATVLVRQDKWQEALTRHRRAYEEFQALDRPYDAAICLRNVAVCHVNLHNFREALEIYEEGQAFCRRQGLSRLVMEMDYNIAYLHFLRGEYTRAIRLFRQARRETESVGDVYHRALCDLDLSETYLELNLTSEAVELARSAYRAFDRQKLPLETAKALTNRAIAVSRRGQAELALRLLDQARKIFLREGNRLWPALIDFYCAVVLAREARSEEALVLARQALQTFARSAAESRTVMCELLIARLQFELAQIDEARLTVRAALRRLEGLDLPALEHRAFRVLGEIEERRGDRERAQAAFRKSYRWLEEMHSQLQGDDLKIAFFKDKQSVYESLVWLTLRPDPESDADGSGFDLESCETAFEIIEKAKSRILADLMAFRAHALRPRDEHRGTLAEKVRGLREELNWFYRQIDMQQMSGEESVRAEIQSLRRDAREKEEQLLRAQRELQASDHELSSLQSAAMVDLATVRTSLPDEAVLLEYFIARQTIFAAVVDKRSLNLVELGPVDRIRELQRLLQFQFARAARFAQCGGRERAVAELSASTTRSHLRQLHLALIEPVEHLLDGRRLILAPHGFLHYLPFHALIDGDGKALIETRALSYTPSASVYHLCATKDVRHDGRSLVLGVADERAPHIRDEAVAVAESLPDATLLLGSEAGEDELRQLGPGRRYVHIATHGLFRRDNPMFSAVQLGRSRLALFDLYNLRLDADLVVLSGCGTGLNAVLGADELLGLTRGLLYAGARCLLVTLWDVHDASTAVFMRRFYRHLETSNRAEALRRAVLEHRDEYPEPYYWAPFILVGEAG